MHINLLLANPIQILLMVKKFIGITYSNLLKFYLTMNMIILKMNIESEKKWKKSLLLILMKDI